MHGSCSIRQAAQIKVLLDTRKSLVVGLLLSIRFSRFLTYVSGSDPDT